MDAPRLPAAQDVRDAAERIAGRIKRTPLVHARKLSALTGADIWLKLENLQYTGAFKERGALNKLMAMPEEENARSLWQNGLYFFSMVGILVFANWGQPQSAEGL